VGIVAQVERWCLGLAWLGLGEVQHGRLHVSSTFGVLGAMEK